MKEASYAQDRVTTIEHDRKEVADEYVALKANYSLLNKAHEREVR